MICGRLGTAQVAMLVVNFWVCHPNLQGVRLILGHTQYDWMQSCQWVDAHITYASFCWWTSNSLKLPGLTQPLFDTAGRRRKTWKSERAQRDTQRTGHALIATTKGSLHAWCAQNTSACLLLSSSCCKSPKTATGNKSQHQEPHADACGS